MPAKSVSLDSPIEQRIAWAEDWFQIIGNQILEDDTAGLLLKRLKEAVESSHREMTDSGIIRICRDCDRNEGGSCCGRGLENHYSGVLLLINLLLGVELPKTRHDPSGCFFLDQDGCRLRARHVICINYVCKRITQSIPPQALADLREKEGEELKCLFLLNERIIKFIREKVDFCDTSAL